MNKLQQLLESANPYKSLQSDAARLTKKWMGTGLLEGIERDIDQNNMSMILENQAKQLVTETSSTGGGSGAGTFTVGTGGQWAGVALPLVRKVFGQLSTKEFVSVQPMNLPSGLVFFLDFQYGTTKSPFASGGSLYGDKGVNNPFGNTNTGGLYGAGRFGYSTNNTSSAATISTTASANWYSDFNVDGDYSASLANYSTYTIATSSMGANFDAEAIRSFTLTSSLMANTEVLPQFTKISGGNIVFVALDNLGSAATGSTSIVFSLQPTDKNRGDFEDGNTNLNANNSSITIPEINVQMSSEAIVAKTKKLKAVWTPEFAQDLEAYQSLDAEAELTSVMSEYISLEIDLEILDMLIESATNTAHWTAQNNVSLNGTGVLVADLGYYNSQGQWFQTLGTKIQKLSNDIHQRNLRGGANWLVVAPKVATILESIPGFASNSDGDVSKAQYAFGVQKAGTLNSTYTVYKNPYMTENTILMGYKGGQFLEAGAVFAPYVPLIMTPLVYDPDTFTPRKGLLTRYAKKVVRPEFFGKIYVGGLDTI